MKRILWAVSYLLLAVWFAFDPFSKAPKHPDPLGNAFQFISAAFVFVTGWVHLRKRAQDDKPNW